MHCGSFDVVATLGEVEQSVMAPQQDVAKIWLPAAYLLAPSKRYMLAALIHSAVSPQQPTLLSPLPHEHDRPQVAWPNPGCLQPTCWPPPNAPRWPASSTLQCTAC